MFLYVLLIPIRHVLCTDNNRVTKETFLLTMLRWTIGIKVFFIIIIFYYSKSISIINTLLNYLMRLTERMKLHILTLNT